MATSNILPHNPVTQVMMTGQQTQDMKTAGVPLSDFILQLEDYATTVSVYHYFKIYLSSFLSL